MAAPQIYIPGAKASNPRQLANVGLDSIAGEPGETFIDVLANGPDGGAGVCVYWDYPNDPDKRVERPGVHPESQIWKPAIAEGDLPAGRYWLGWEVRRPPRPHDLERKRIHAGGDVVLNDGNAWHFPTARQLPHVLGIGPAVIDDPYKPFYEWAQRALNQWLVTHEESIRWAVPHRDGFSFAVAALAINYRLTAGMVDMLRLVRSDHLTSIARVVTEGWAYERIYELAQKKTPCMTSQDTPSIASGAPT